MKFSVAGAGMTATQEGQAVMVVAGVDPIFTRADLDNTLVSLVPSTPI
jgi:hypothetical protein